MVSGSEIQKQPSWVIISQAVSWSCSQHVSQGCRHLKTCLQLEDILAGWHIPVTGESIQTGCKQVASVPHHVYLSIVLLECLTLWQLAFCWLQRPMLFTGGADYIRSWTPRVMIHWGHFERWLPQCLRMILYNTVFSQSWLFSLFSLFSLFVLWEHHKGGKGH